jgi:hypothetical protein
VFELRVNRFAAVVSRLVVAGGDTSILGERWEIVVGVAAQNENQFGGFGLARACGER